MSDPYRYQMSKTETAQWRDGVAHATILKFAAAQATARGFSHFLVVDIKGCDVIGTPWTSNSVFE